MRIYGYVTLFTCVAPAPARLEPTTPGSVSHCVIHWATRSPVYLNLYSVPYTQPGSNWRPSAC